MDCFVASLLAMTAVRIPATRMRPSPDQLSLRSLRAQGMPGARCTRGLIRKWRRGAHEHTGSAEAPGHPLRNGLRLMPCSPRRRIRLVTVIGGFFAIVQTRSGLDDHRRLGTSNGCQDHTVLPYARNVVRRYAPSRLTHEVHSPCDPLARRRSRVHHIPSRVRDDRDTPLLAERDERT